MVLEEVSLCFEGKGFPSNLHKFIEEVFEGGHF